jgi:hypothetical protein
MWEIKKGYKVGRAVMFYDLVNLMDNQLREKVSKDEVVKLCESGEVQNTKIQWWEGKPIVRCGNKDLPIVKISEQGEVIGIAETAKRNCSSKQSVQADVSSKAVVIGKLANKKKKEDISYVGYAKENVQEQCKLRSTINYNEIDTVGCLFVTIAKEYKLTRVDEYLKQFAKKMNPDKKLSSMAQSTVASVQGCINTYLMNMAYMEIAEVNKKYSV